jgi:hypothetical protein
MRQLWALISICMACTGVTACGAATHQDKSAADRSLADSVEAGAKPPAFPHRMVVRNSVRSDGDADSTKDIDGNGDVDPGVDKDNDSPSTESHAFPDADDRSALGYGQMASHRQARILANVVQRYYATAWAGNGAAGCRMLLSSLAHAVAIEYGREIHTTGLRRGKTCATVMTAIYARLYGQLVAPITVITVSINGKLAQAIFGSKTLPASEILLEREGSRWAIGKILGTPLA